MEAKWPFMLITFVLLFLLGLTIANLEKTAVMNNWTERRCDLPVVFTASFFKPADNPTTGADFAKDNFSFCMKSYVDKFILLLMAPINTIFSSQMGATSNAMDSVNTLRSMTQTMFNAFSSYIAGFYKKFNSSVFEMSRIVQYLRMAVGRANAMVISMIYAGLTMFRGMINSFQLVIRVVLIICAIMLIIIIILFFILFPVMPIIMSTLAAVITIVVAMSMVMSGALASEANTDKSGFCFSEGTQIPVKEKDGTIRLKPVEEIVLGDELDNDCGKVTAVIHMEGNDIPLYQLNGIYVSGSHLVKGTDTIWKLVAHDERAHMTGKTSKVLYCFNTTSNDIPVVAKDKSIILFRDWEEIGNEDEETQRLWNQLIFSILNKNMTFTPKEGDIKTICNNALVGREVLIKTQTGFVPISRIELSNHTVLDMDGKVQSVKGIVWGEVEDAKETDGKWTSDLYHFEDGAWRSSESSVSKGDDIIQGMSLMTETGTFIIWDEVHQKEKMVRDFTEVGYQHIHETYSFVDARLRITSIRISKA